jgi:two-component system chemotaxis response regulator CheB
MTPNKDIIVIGTSAGGVSALKELVAGLPADLEAAVMVVLHLGASDPSYLHEILGRHAALPVSQAEDRDPVRPGRILVARPDYHLVLEDESVRLVRGPKENRCRPSIDALFRSAAFTYGPRVVGVVLTGTLDDGSAGLWWIKERGGTAIVQDPNDAEFPAMPRNALSQVSTDHIVSVGAMGPLLVRLSHEASGADRGDSPKELRVQTQIAGEKGALSAGVMTLGPITPYTCPQCHGVLVQVKEGGVPHFRCHTGHGYSINTLLAEVTEYVEDSLWNSIRSIEEGAMLLQHLARHSRDEVKDLAAAKLFDEKAKDTLEHAEVLRKVAHQHQTLSRDNLTEVDDNRSR